MTLRWKPAETATPTPTPTPTPSLIVQIVEEVVTLIDPTPSDDGPVVQVDYVDEAEYDRYMEWMADQKNIVASSPDAITSALRKALAQAGDVVTSFVTHVSEETEEPQYSGPEGGLHWTVREDGGGGGGGSTSTGAGAGAAEDHAPFFVTSEVARFCVVLAVLFFVGFFAMYLTRRSPARAEPNSSASPALRKRKKLQ